MKKIGLILLLSCIFALVLPAQNGTDPKNFEKEFQEKIDQEIEKYESTLKLEGWQVFYVDSILNHDYKALQAELSDMSRVKVSNTDLYMMTQDKWMEKIYQSFKGILSEEQWERYLKTGAAKEKKARDKRAAKRNVK